jgi:glucose-1-phosphate adenylyltransferase
VYDFKDNKVPGATEKDINYWRDVGTIDAFHEAHMDLVSIDPEFNLYNSQWPIFTDQVQAPGAKFVIRGRAEDSIVNAGCIISGGEVERTVMSPNVRVDKWAQVSDAVLMDGVQLGRNTVVRRAIIDKEVVVPDGVQIGVDHEHDRARGFEVSDNGITVVGKDVTVPRD